MKRASLIPDSKSHGLLSMLAGFLVLLGANEGRSFDWLPSRLQLEKVSTMTTSDAAEYGFCVYRPDSTGGDSYVFMTKFFTPALAGYWSRAVIWNSQGRVTDQLNFFRKAKFIAGRDVDFDGDEELVISFADDSSCTVVVYDSVNAVPVSEYTLYERDYRWRNTKVWETTLHIGRLIRPADSNPLLLLTPGAGHGKMPKGILAIDPATGTEKWHYWIGGDHSGNNGEFVYIPKLGKSLYVYGTYGSANGAQWNGTSDDRAYLLALDAMGHEVWRWERPGPFTGLDFAYSFTEAGTQRPLLFALYRCVGSDVTAESLYCVDAASGIILRRAPVAIGGTDSKCRPWNPAPNGGSQFLVWNSTSGIGVFDENLRLVRERPQYQSVMNADDIDGDGKLELVAATRDSKTAILDDDFSRLATYPVHWMGFEYPPRFQWSSQEKYPYLIGAGKDEIARVRLRKTPHYALAVGARLAMGALLLLVIGYGPVWAVRARVAYVKVRREREQTRAWAAMASKLAHDIRTPVSVLQLSGHNLEQELELEYGEIPEHIRKYFDTFRRESARTENAAKSMLKFARVEKPVLEPVNLERLVRETVDAYPHSTDLEIAYEIESGLSPVWVDRQQMISLIENLVSNGIKAMKGKGTLSVRARRAQGLPLKGKPRDVFELEIADSGSGISKQDLPRVFDPYFSHTQGGTGLGLVIVKKIVEDHEGSVHIESEPGSGTSVRVRIPVDSRRVDG